jgi:hypothetical protein
MKAWTSLIWITLFTLPFDGCSKHSPDATSTLQKDSIIQTNLSVPRMSQQQVIEVAWSQLQQNLRYRCNFKNGEWDILEVPIGVDPTNATRVVLRVRDADGQTEPVQIP